MTNEDRRLAERLARERAEILAILEDVPDYQGILDASPLTMLISGLVADHQGLETRIEAALVYLADLTPQTEVAERVQQILRGQIVPDTPEGITGG